MKLCTTNSFHRHKHLCGLLQQGVAKTIQKWHNGDWFHHYHNVPVHLLSLQEFLDNNGKTINLHPLTLWTLWMWHPQSSFSSNLTGAGGQRFHDISMIQELQATFSEF